MEHNYCPHIKLCCNYLVHLFVRVAIVHVNNDCIIHVLFHVNTVVPICATCLKVKSLCIFPTEYFVNFAFNMILR